MKNDKVTDNCEGGILYTISAPSGTGKTSLVKALVTNNQNVSVSISYTTRPMRPGEIEGKHYYFIDDNEFNKKIQNEEFLEYACVFGHYYGTSETWVRSMLKNNSDIILEIDWQGAQQVAEKIPETVQIFILPPSKEILRERLVNRGQDDIHIVEKRLNQAHKELLYYDQTDYLLINNNFDDALQDLQSIVRCHQLKRLRQKQQHSELLNKLLS